MLPFLFIIIYLVLVLIRPQEYPGWPFPGVPFLPLALACALLAWMFSREKRFDAPQYPLVVMFLLVTCLSVLVSGWPGGAMQQFSGFLATVMAFVLLGNAVDTQRKVIATMAVFVLCASVLALHGADQATTGEGWTGTGLVNDGRIQYVGIFSDPNDLGMLFVMCVPMAVYLGARGGMMGLRRLFWWGACLLLVYGIYLTHSRGALVAVIAMAGVYVLVRRGPVLAGMLGLVALAGLQLMPNRMSDIDVQEASAAGRVDAWYEGMQLLIAHPVFGVGTGRFTDYHHLTAHNSYVLVLAENGVVGFTIWLAFVGYCFWMMYRVLRHEPEFAEGEEHLAWDWWESRRMSLALLVSLTGFFTAAFFLSRSYVILLYLLAALVVAHFTVVRGLFPGVEGFSLKQNLLRWPVIAAAVTIGLYLMVKVLLAFG